MALSHFDEKSGIVSCDTAWGQWWQTVNEVYIEVDVPHGTKGKECKVSLKTGHIECRVKDKVIFEGDLCQNIIVDDSTWTLEEQKKISILLAKAKKFELGNLWESLLSEDQYAPNPFVREQMLKKLDLEKFQMENTSGDERSSPRVEENENEEDAQSNVSRSDDELDESNEQERGSESSSQPRSPSSVDREQSDDEVHISEPEVSNHGSDAEEDDVERSSVASDVEADNNERGSGGSDVEMSNEAERDEDSARNEQDDEAQQDSDQEGSVNIQSDDDDEEGNIRRIDSDAEDGDNQPKSPVEDSDEEREDEVKRRQSPAEEEMNSPKSSPQAARDEDDDDSDVGTPVKKKKPKGNRKLRSDSEASEEEENDGDVANIFGDSEGEGSSPRKEGKGTQKKKKMVKKMRATLLSDSEDEKSDAEEKVPDEEAGDHSGGEEAIDHSGGEEAGDHSGDEEREKDEEKGEKEKDEAPAEQMEEVQHQKEKHVSDDDSDEGVDQGRSDFISDFDLMMQKKKEESSKRRKRKDVDIINDSDDLIADIIVQMRLAADEDRQLNKVKQTATKKLKILPLVMSQLKKQDLKMAFLDQGVLNVMADWLAPLPDRSLPNIQIREGMIQRLSEFPFIDQSLLKSSGIGRALMYLFKHPKETKENRERAGKLITEWARPIFNVTTDYHSLTKEEREQRDFDHVPTKKRKGKDQDEVEESQDIDSALQEGGRKLRPGDKGWIGRARVPMPSTKDYVVRPKWNVEMECGRSSAKKPLGRFEKHIKNMQEKKKNSKSLRAVTISIEGRKMAI